MIPTIAAGFLLLAALLLWVVRGSRGRWPLKLGAIVVCSAFTFAVWDALDSFSGWPAREELPKRALHVAGEVVEPHSIYLWLVPADEPGPLGYESDNLEPRAYRLPYSRELHAVVERANRLLREGRRVELREVVQPRGAHGAPRLQAHPLVLPASRKETVSRP